MHTKNYYLMFDDIINSSLYATNELNKEEKDTLKEIVKALEETKNLSQEIKTLMTDATKDNEYQYKIFIRNILQEAKIKNEVILDCLQEDNFYNDLLFLKLDTEGFNKYILTKEFFTQSNIKLINDYLIAKKSIISTLLQDNESLSKLPEHSLEFRYSKFLEKFIDIDNKSLIEKLSISTIKDIIKNRFARFADFKLIKDKFIINYLPDNSLDFPVKDKDEVKAFILDNPGIASKFSSIYFDDMTTLELQSLYDKNVINPSILEAIYKNGGNINKVYSRDNIAECNIGSISFNPFKELKSDLKFQIINTPHLLNRFDDYVIYEAITTNVDEDEIMTMFRKPSFLQSINSYSLELILNSLSFRNLFNMLQNHFILEKINNINVNIKAEDKVFVRGYLDSTLLIHKTAPNMVYNMLEFVPRDKILTYLAYPYILEKINNNDLINLIIKNKIDFMDIVNNDFIFRRLNTTHIVNYINELWSVKVDLDLIKEPKILKRIFNLNDEVIKKIDFEEVNYLFETIRTKDILSMQESPLTVKTYQAVLASYLTFGISGTLDIINEGNNNLKVATINETIHDITKQEVRKYRDNNYILLQNIDKKIVDKLKLIHSKTISVFEKDVMNIPYLDSLIRLMVSSRYTTFEEVLKVLHNYKMYDDKLEARKELKDFCDSFKDYYLNRKKEEVQASLIDIAKENCVLKAAVSRKDYKNKMNAWLKKLKVELFIKIMHSKKVNNLFYKDGIVIDLEEKYFKEFNVTKEEANAFFNEVLKPLVNNNFSVDEYLASRKIEKPKDYDCYEQAINDRKAVKKINDELEYYKYFCTNDELLEIMNYILYGKEMKIKISTININKLRDMALSIIGEVYINKVTMRIEYGQTLDISDEDELISYKNSVDVVNKMIDKTIKFINKHLDDKNITRIYYEDFIRFSKKTKAEHEFNKANYEVKNRVYSLKDLELLFDGYDLNSEITFDENLDKLLFDLQVIDLAACGLYKDSISKLGYIISSWNKIKKACEILKVDIDKLDLFEINKIVMTLNHGYSNQELEYVINHMSSDNYCYEKPNLKDRIDLLINVYSDAKLVNSKAIPMLGVSNEDYRLETLDNQSHLNYLLDFDTDYRIGAYQNNLLCFSVLSKDGAVLVIKDHDNNIVGRINAIRNGNTLILTTPIVKDNIDIKDLLNSYAHKLLDFTKDSEEPINAVIINNYNAGINIDNSTIPYLNEPIKENDQDYQKLKNNGYLMPNSINDVFKNSVFTIVASNKTINRNNFKSYSAKGVYPRIRNEVIIINGICNSWEETKIANIIIEYCMLNNIEIQKFDFEKYEKIYLLDDAVVLIDKEQNIYSYILPYDERASIEVDSIIKTYKQETKKI